MNLQELHASIDWLLAKSFERSPLKPCCADCHVAHCCSEPAYCDEKEAAALLASLTPDQLLDVKDNLEEWIRRFEPFKDQDMPNAFDYREADVVCPLLKSGRCMAYAQRPIGCRMFFALGDPDGCDMPARRHQKIAEWQHPSAFDSIAQTWLLSNASLELDHIGAHLVRLLKDPSFTTGSHTKYEVEQTTQPV